MGKTLQRLILGGQGSGKHTSRGGNTCTLASQTDHRGCAKAASCPSEASVPPGGGGGLSGRDAEDSGSRAPGDADPQGELIWGGREAHAPREPARSPDGGLRTFLSKTENNTRDPSAFLGPPAVPRRRPVAPTRCLLRAEDADPPTPAHDTSPGQRRPASPRTGTGGARTNPAATWEGYALLGHPPSRGPSSLRGPPQEGPGLRLHRQARSRGDKRPCDLVSPGPVHPAALAPPGAPQAGGTCALPRHTARSAAVPPQRRMGTRVPSPPGAPGLPRPPRPGGSVWAEDDAEMVSAPAPKHPAQTRAPRPSRPGVSRPHGGRTTRPPARARLWGTGAQDARTARRPHVGRTPVATATLRPG